MTRARQTDLRPVKCLEGGSLLFSGDSDNRDPCDQIMQASSSGRARLYNPNVDWSLAILLLPFFLQHASRVLKNGKRTQVKKSTT